MADWPAAHLHGMAATSGASPGRRAWGPSTHHDVLRSGGIGRCSGLGRQGCLRPSSKCSTIAACGRRGVGGRRDRVSPVTRRVGRPGGGRPYRAGVCFAGVASAGSCRDRRDGLDAPISHYSGYRSPLSPAPRRAAALARQALSGAGRRARVKVTTGLRSAAIWRPRKGEVLKYAKWVLGYRSGGAPACCGDGHRAVAHRQRRRS